MAKTYNLEHGGCWGTKHSGVKLGDGILARLAVDIQPYPYQPDADQGALPWNMIPVSAPVSWHRLCG